MRKPKKSNAMTLEELSLRGLPHLFEPEHFQIREENRRDVGIDLSIEIATHEFTNWRFNVQLKAKQKATKSVTRKIRTSNIAYMRSPPMLGIYILWIKETDRYYYEWVDEFFQFLEDNVPKWSNQKSNTLHFTKELKKQEVFAIKERVERHATIYQQLKDGKRIEDVLDSFHNADNHDLYDDVENSLVMLIDLFEGLSVIRPELLAKFPPFAKSKDSKSSFRRTGRTIETDNAAVLNYFNNLELVDNSILSRTTGLCVNKEKITKILRFLEQNLIHHIEYFAHMKSERVCIHALYLTYEPCNCEKCSYGNLRWNNVLSGLAKGLNKEDPYHWLRRAYMLLELGKIREAYQLYHDLSRYSKKQKQMATHIVARQCMVAMSFFVEHRYTGTDRQSMIAEINSIDVRNEIYFLAAEGKMSRELVIILITMIDTKYFHELYVDAEIQYQNVISAYNVDQQGHTIHTQLYQSMAQPLTEMTVFAEANAFHGQFFNGFGSVAQKLIESALMLYSLQNPESERLESFDNYLVHVLFRYVRAEDFNKLLFRHDIKTIVFEARHAEGEKKLTDLFDNFFETFSAAEEFSIKEANKDNSAPNDVLGQQTRKICLLLSVMEASDETLNHYAERVVNIMKKKRTALPDAVAGFRDILKRRGHRLQASVLVDLYKWLLVSQDHGNAILLIDIPNILRNNHVDFAVFDPEIQGAINAKLTERNRVRRGDDELILAFWQIAPRQIKDNIRNYVIQRLQRSFNADLYYRACLQGVIEVHPFLDSFKASIPISETVKIFGVGLGYESIQNTRLTQFIRLCFKLNIDLKDPSIQSLHEGIDYYMWLLNLDSFDYSKFNPYWILTQPLDDFFNEFKKHPIIKTYLKAYLTTTRSQRLAEYYIKHFAE